MIPKLIGGLMDCDSGIIGGLAKANPEMECEKKSDSEPTGTDKTRQLLLFKSNNHN